MLTNLSQQAPGGGDNGRRGAPVQIWKDGTRTAQCAVLWIKIQLRMTQKSGDRWMVGAVLLADQPLFSQPRQVHLWRRHAELLLYMTLDVSGEKTALRVRKLLEKNPIKELGRNLTVWVNTHRRWWGLCG